MICTFCGAENPTVNRFCGMCGVRLERRKAERRVVSKREDTVCHSCGHVNESRFKFCGICGVSIERRAHERRDTGEHSRAAAYANAQLPSPEPRRTVSQRTIENPSRSATMVATEPQRHQSATMVAEEEPYTSSLGGPSFLGLNDAQGDSEYLLEEERPSGRGLRAFLLLVILAAIVGLIYVQYRSSLKGGSKSPELPKPDPATVPQRSSQSQSPGLQKAIAAVTGAQSLQAATLAVSKATVPEAKDTSGGDPIEKKLRKVTVAEMRDDEAREKAPDQPPAPAKSKPSPALIRAQQYLHGRGVAQNCEQGLIYLKAATQDNDPSAAVQMAALYASGFCVAQDRVKAYQWFSTAREQQPENPWIAKNLSQLWAQMTPQERRQIR